MSGAKAGGGGQAPQLQGPGPDQRTGAPTQQAREGRNASQGGPWDPRLQGAHQLTPSTMPTWNTPDLPCQDAHVLSHLLFHPEDRGLAARQVGKLRLGEESLGTAQVWSKPLPLAPALGC